MRSSSHAAPLALAAALLAGPAQAEDNSRDRAEFEAAAGRALLFDATSVAELDPSRPREATAAAPREPAQRPARRGVRVVLPSPYGR